MSENLLLLNKKNRQLRYGPEATFTRASVAYNSALQQVASGLPRIESKGVMVEEGTTNLLPAGAENFVTGWANGTGETCTVVDYPVNIPGIGNVIAKRITGNGAGSTAYDKRKLILSGLANPHTSTISVLAMLASSEPAYLTNWNDTTTKKTITNVMTRHTVTITNFASVTDGFFFGVSANNKILDIVVYAPQIENKAYATSYTPPGTTRAAESLTVPASCLNATAGTVEMDVDFDNLQNVCPKSRPFLAFGEYPANHIALYRASGSHNILLDSSSAGGWPSQYSNTGRWTIAVTGINRVAVAYNAAELSFYVDGVKRGFVANPYLPSVVADIGLLSHQNIIWSALGTHIKSARFSSIARSDAEMAYTGRLYKDSHTTFLRNWRG